MPQTAKSEEVIELLCVTKLNACSDQGVDDRWCTGFRTAHTALFTCSAYRAGDGQLFNSIVRACMYVLTYVLVLMQVPGLFRVVSVQTRRVLNLTSRVTDAI